MKVTTHVAFILAGFPTEFTLKRKDLRTLQVKFRDFFRDICGEKEIVIRNR